MIGAVGGTHYAAGALKLWRVAGSAHHEQLESIVDYGGVAGSAACPLVELEHRLMAAGVEKLGDAALPLGKFPLYWSDALLGWCGNDDAVVGGQ